MQKDKNNGNEQKVIKMNARLSTKVEEALSKEISMHSMLDKNHIDDED